MAGGTQGNKEKNLVIRKTAIAHPSDGSRFQPITSVEKEKEVVQLEMQSSSLKSGSDVVKEVKNGRVSGGKGTQRTTKAKEKEKVPAQKEKILSPATKNRIAKRSGGSKSNAKNVQKPESARSILVMEPSEETPLPFMNRPVSLITP